MCEVKMIIKCIFNQAEAQIFNLEQLGLEAMVYPLLPPPVLFQEQKSPKESFWLFLLRRYWDKGPWTDLLTSCRRNV